MAAGEGCNYNNIACQRIYYRHLDFHLIRNFLNLYLLLTLNNAAMLGISATLRTK